MVMNEPTNTAAPAATASETKRAADDLLTIGQCREIIRNARKLGLRIETGETMFGGTALSMDNVEANALRAQLATAHEALAVLRNERDELKQRLALRTDLHDIDGKALMGIAAERDEANAKLGAFRALANMHAKRADGYEDELAALRDLANVAMRAASDTERLMAASVLCARLVRSDGVAAALAPDVVAAAIADGPVTDEDEVAP